MKLLRSVRGKRFAVRLLKWLGRRTGYRHFERMAAFAGIGSLDSQETVFSILQGYYPSDAEFIVLAMDFEFMGAGKPEQSYLEQLDELRALAANPVFGARIHPFIALDPRREGFLDLAKRCIDSHGFAGIKLYPALGFCPADDRLLPLWEWAESRHIPIMTHASRGGVYFRGRPGEISWPEDDLKPDHAGKARDWTDRLSDPAEFRPVLKRFPNLKICFAHLGGGDECEKWLSKPWPDHLNASNWLTEILSLMKTYPQVYSDLSYVGFQTNLHPLLHVLIRDHEIGSRLLFGSDFYMVQQDATEREFSIRLRSLLSEHEYDRISKINPQQYLARS
jgi:predicted TIM-barrel fold metal-dependent hydrolase